MIPVELEPPTEPFSSPAVLVTPPAPPPPPIARSPFSETHFRFTTGLRAGEVATIRASDDRVLLSYRSFASVSGIVAALVSAIVALAGIAAVLFLLAERAPIRAFVALGLTMFFATVIAMLVPRSNVTLYDDQHPALTISQLAVFPSGSYVVTTPNGAVIAEFRKSFWSRLGRNRWTIWQEGRFLGDAMEESFGGALVRKVLGKFSRSFETNLRIAYGGIVAGHILRKPAPDGRADVLEVTTDALDRRLAVALATLVLGREP